MPVSSQEEKEIQRVFDHLCDYQKKYKINQELKDLNEWINANELRHQAQLNAGNTFHLKDPVDDATKQRMEDLKAELHELENNPDRKISCDDVYAVMKNLNQKVTKNDVEEMVWEVDEGLDGCLDINEFRLMFNRNIMDKTGLEPSRMFNLTQFLIYDTNYNGHVSVDETMNLLYARYGRSKMEQKLKELFGEDMHETGREGGEINFTKFLKAVEKVQMDTFLKTTKGKIAVSKGFNPGDKADKKVKKKK